MSGSSQSTTKQQSGPPEWQANYLKDIFGQAQGLYEGSPLEYGPDRVAGFDWREILGQNKATANAQGNAETVAANARGGLDFGLNGALDPDSNPYLAKSATAALKPVWAGLNEQVLPGLRDEGIASGVLGSSRQGIAEGLATRGATEVAADTTSKMYSDAYNRGLT